MDSSFILEEQHCNFQPVVKHSIYVNNMQSISDDDSLTRIYGTFYLHWHDASSYSTQGDEHWDDKYT
jgi:hypothetical protein